MIQNLSNTPNSSSLKRSINQANRNPATRQKIIHTFDSFDPHSKSKELSQVKNEGFTVVGRKKNNVNRNKDNNSNNNNNRNKNKNLVESTGTGTATGLVTKSKQFFIYLGRIAIETNNNQVAEYLKNTFPNVKINNLTEINSEKENR